MTLRLFDYPASANCYKVRLLLAQLGIEYERVPVDIFAGETMNPEYGARNPALTTPVLELGPGRHLPESGAILLYLAEGTELLPDGPDDRAQVHRWMFYEQGTIVAIIGSFRFRLLTGRLAEDSEECERLRRMTTAIVATVNHHLSQHEFAAADRYTVADIALYGYLHVAHETGIAMEPFAGLAAWLERVREQPGHVADLMPYPPNSQRGASQSIYDRVGM